MQCQKAPKDLPNCLKRAETNAVLVVFDDDVRAYTATVSYRRLS